MSNKASDGCKVESGPGYLPTSWPQPLRNYLLTTYGEPIKLILQSGQSQACVWQIDFPQLSLVIKKASLREGYFYQNIADILRSQGVSTPYLLWQQNTEAVSWLVLEYIPTPLPRSRWLADPIVLATLSRLHQSRLPEGIEIPNLFQPQWTEAMNEQALMVLPSSERIQLNKTLSTLRFQSAPLFEAHSWISGDPNPGNWGLRENTQIVLYDWERFSRGNPALDLAITIPGLGDRNAFKQIATLYRAYQKTQLLPSGKVQLSTLVDEMILAKVWTIVEYLSHYQLNAESIKHEAVAHLQMKFSQWVTNIR